MSSVRVAVTGVGVISSIGCGFSEFSSALLRGASGRTGLTLIDADRFRSAFACEVRGFDAGPWFRHGNPAAAGRAAQFAVGAARMAAVDAFGDVSVLATRPGVVTIGTTDGGSRELDTIVEKYYGVGRIGVAANDVRKVPADHIERTVVAELGLCRAESFVNGAACAASNQALGLAVDAIMSGDAEFALAGGADALCQRAFAAFTRLNLMAPELCQPFDISRKGLLLGEGAAMLVLEDLERARSRGARVYAEVLGYAANCDRRHAVQPDAESLAECMRTGLERAGLRPGQVDLICAHGSGTPTNDLVESEALRAVFVDPPPVTAVKSMLGHTMGAAGAMGALAGLAAIGAQEIPPTINHVTTDPSCALDCVAGQSRPQSITVVQNNALGFFGNNAVTFFKRLSEVA